jgi:hypothetical protein
VPVALPGTQAVTGMEQAPGTTSHERVEKKAGPSRVLENSAGDPGPPDVGNKQAPLTRRVASNERVHAPWVYRNRTETEGQKTVRFQIHTAPTGPIWK